MSNEPATPELHYHSLLSHYYAILVCSFVPTVGWGVGGLMCQGMSNSGDLCQLAINFLSPENNIFAHDYH